MQRPASYYSQFFKLLCDLVENFKKQVEKGRCNSNLLDMKDIFNNSVKMIKAHASIESIDPLAKDHTLIGLFQLAHLSLLQCGVSQDAIQLAIDHNLMNELFEHCLFPDNKNDMQEDITPETDPTVVTNKGNKCNSDESR